MSQVTRRELFPGVWLRTVHTTKFKSAYLSATFLAPLDKHTAGDYALLPAVLRRGSQAHPDLEHLSAALDELYGGAIEPAIRKKGDTQCVGFVASFLDDAYALEGEQILESATQLLGEILLTPYTQNGIFCPDYVQGEKENLIQRIRGQINDKRTYATYRLCQIMGQGEPFGVDKLGEEGQVASITPSSLWQSYQSLLREGALELYYCGGAAPERVEAALRQALRTLPQGGQRQRPACQVSAPTRTEPNVIEEQLEVSQGKLALGFHTGGITCQDPRYPALAMMNAIFGGTTLSKLFMNVRERLSLCYYASSMVEKLKGLVLVSSGIEFERYQQAKDEILAQLAAITKGEIEDGELEGARRTLVGLHLTTLDDQARQEEFWLSQAVAEQDTTLEALAAQLETVTRAQVAQAAQCLTLDTIYFLNGTGKGA